MLCFALGLSFAADMFSRAHSKMATTRGVLDSPVLLLLQSATGCGTSLTRTRRTCEFGPRGNFDAGQTIKDQAQPAS